MTLLSQITVQVSNYVIFATDAPLYKRNTSAMDGRRVIVVEAPQGFWYESQAVLYRARMPQTCPRRVFTMTTSQINTIILSGDCKQTLKSVRSDSVNLVVSSPPYGLQKTYGDTPEKRQSLEDYLADMSPVLSEICRILKETGSLCWQVGNHVQDGEILPLDIPFHRLFKQLGFALRNRIVWRFEHGLTASKRFSGRYETILWFTKSDAYTFNLDSVRVPAKYPGKKHFKGLNYGLPSS